MNVMTIPRIIVSIALSLFVWTMQAQDFYFGVKAGIHYNFSGDLTETTEAGTTIRDALNGAQNREGYHGGAYMRMAFSKFFIQPELIYSRYKNAFDAQEIETLVNKKIDIPVLLGLKFFDALYVNAGPDFQYMLPPDFSISTTEVTFKDFTTGLHLGFGVSIKSLSLDVRYERGLTPNEIEFIGDTGSRFRFDNRPNRLMFSLQLDL
jgi:hypothetical protein